MACGDKAFLEIYNAARVLSCTKQKIFLHKTDDLKSRITRGKSTGAAFAFDALRQLVIGILAVSIVPSTD